MLATSIINQFICEINCSYCNKRWYPDDCDSCGVYGRFQSNDLETDHKLTHITCAECDKTWLFNTCDECLKKDFTLCFVSSPSQKSNTPYKCFLFPSKSNREYCDIKYSTGTTKELLQLWKYVSDISFFQKKINTVTELYPFESIHKIFSSLSSGYRIDANYIDPPGFNYDSGDGVKYPKLTNDNYTTGIEKLQSDLLITNLINLCKGHLFLCGGAIVSVLLQKEINDYDFFFVCDTVEEADHYLRICLEFIDSSFKDNLNKYISNPNVITIKSNRDVFQFIRRLYTSPNQILDGFDLPACKFGYGYLTQNSSKCDIFTNIEGGLSIITMSFPINCNQITTSHSSRIDKYNNKGFNILLPGVCDSVSQLNSMDIYFQRNTGYGFSSNIWYIHYNGGIVSDYDPKLTKFPINTIMNKPYMVRYHSPDAISLMDVTCDAVINKTCDVRMNKDQINKFSKNYAKYIMGDRYKEWAMAMFIDDDDEKREEIWDLRILDIKSILKQSAIKTKHCKWKVKNPGDQFFGKVNPLKVTPKDFYGGGEYIPFNVGISDDIYVVVVQWLRLYAVPQDLIELIFMYMANEQCDSCFQHLIGS